MTKQKYIIGIFLALVMVCAMVSVVDTVSAAKVKKIDSGKYMDDYGSLNKYATYYNGKTVKIHIKGYDKNPKTKKYTKYIGTADYYLTKTNKKTLKVKLVAKVVGYPTVRDTFYEKTSLTAKSYYNKKIKPTLK